MATPHGVDTAALNHPQSIELTAQYWQYQGERVYVTDVKGERVRIYAEGWGRARWVQATRVTPQPHRAA